MEGRVRLIIRAEEHAPETGRVNADAATTEAAKPKRAKTRFEPKTG